MNSKYSKLCFNEKINRITTENKIEGSKKIKQREMKKNGKKFL